MSPSKLIRDLVLVAMFSMAYPGCSDGQIIESQNTDFTAPDRVTDLTVCASTESTISLTWTAPGDDGTRGRASSYDIRYSPYFISNSTWEYASKLSNIPAPKPSGGEETITVEGLNAWTDYFFCLITSDDADNWSALSNVPNGRTKLPLMTPFRLTYSDESHNPSWSPDGSTIAFASARNYMIDIFTIRATGWMEKQITASASNEISPVWSPDGLAIAFSSVRGGNEDIWTIPAMGGTEKRIVSNPAYDRSPAWSPDGSMIAFESDRSGNMDIWTISVTGGTETQVTNDAEYDCSPSWSPDGSMIAFQSYRNGNTDIWAAPATGGTLIQITTNPWPDKDPAWSPDGSTIAFSSDRSGRDDIWTIPAIGGIETRITTDPAGDIAPSWSPDGSMIAYISIRDLMMDIWIIRIK